MRARTLALFLALPAACGSPPSRVKTEHASIGGDVVARVGDQAIVSSLVSAVAAAQKVDPPRALASLIDDSLAAAGARAAGLDASWEVRRATTATYARTVVEKLRDGAHASGPPTDAEVNDLTATHWVEVDAPERMRVIHAVVVDPKKAELVAAATALASRLAAAEAEATSDTDFEARAKALPHEGLEIKVERLDPFTADGRVASRAGGTYDLDFARGAAGLAPGATSGVVRSSFGWHVIRMIDRLPERKVSFEDRRQLFEKEVETVRARASLDRLVAERATERGVTLENGVDEMMTDATMRLLGGGAGAGSQGP